ncbi:hypothetical protein ACROYT_G014742 [Oculina patagonica]
MVHPYQDQLLLYTNKEYASHNADTKVKHNPFQEADLNIADNVSNSVREEREKLKERHLGKVPKARRCPFCKHSFGAASSSFNKDEPANPGDNDGALNSSLDKSNDGAAQKADSRDNQLDELSDSPDLFGSVAPPSEFSNNESLGDSTQDTPDVEMWESNLQKRYLPSSILSSHESAMFD